MENRSWFISIIIFIFIATVLIALYTAFKSKKVDLPSISNDYKLIGIIDMDFNRHLNVESIREGNDALLMVESNSPVTKNITDWSDFELQNYDFNHDGILDNTDPIWPYLYVVVFNSSDEKYQMKSLMDAGIRAIALKHLTPHGNHTVILSDGSERTLYETNKARSNKT